MAHDDAPEQDIKAPAQKAAVQVPRAGSLVEVFDVRAGWRAGHVGESSPFGTIVHFVVNNDEQMADATVVQLLLDFEGGNVRWPRPKQRSQPAELEGRRVLVPCSVFHQGPCHDSLRPPGLEAPLDQLTRVGPKFDVSLAYWSYSFWSGS